MHSRRCAMHIACAGIYPSACVLTCRRAFREPVPWLSRSSMLRATTKSGKAKSGASQLARASPLQGEGRGFKSLNAHHCGANPSCAWVLFFGHEPAEHLHSAHARPTCRVCLFGARWGVMIAYHSTHAEEWRWRLQSTFISLTSDSRQCCHQDPKARMGRTA